MKPRQPVFSVGRAIYWFLQLLAIRWIVGLFWGDRALTLEQVAGAASIGFIQGFAWYQKLGNKLDGWVNPRLQRLGKGRRATVSDQQVQSEAN